MVLTGFGAWDGGTFFLSWLGLVWLFDLGCCSAHNNMAWPITGN
jgi:hypothetical protein